MISGCGRQLRRPGADNVKGSKDMSDIHGLERVKQMGVTLRDVGHRIVLENDYVRIWEVLLAPGETHEFHIHYHPYVVISLGGGENEVETIFGEKRTTYEPSGATVFIDGMRPVHRLTNKGKIPYLSRLIELKHVTWKPEQTELPTRERHR
jgi:hypothetical protein